LQHPRCVFQVLKRHYSRYTPEMVEHMTGVSQKDFYYLANLLAENSGRERTTVMVYALVWTQHSMRAQFIRTAAILQLLIGNMGTSGGGSIGIVGHAMSNSTPALRRRSYL